MDLPKGTLTRYGIEVGEDHWSKTNSCNGTLGVEGLEATKMAPQRSKQKDKKV